MRPWCSLFQPYTLEELKTYFSSLVVYLEEEDLELGQDPFVPGMLEISNSIDPGERSITQQVGPIRKNAFAHGFTSTIGDESRHNSESILDTAHGNKPTLDVREVNRKSATDLKIQGLEMSVRTFQNKKISHNALN